jgi:integrase
MDLIIREYEVDQPAAPSFLSLYECDEDHLARPWDYAAQMIPIVRRPVAGPMFREAIDRFYREVVKVHRTPKGIANVEGLLHAHLYPAWGEMQLQQIKKKTIKALLHEVGTTRPVRYRDRTDGRKGRANSIFSFLKSFFVWASDDDNGEPYLEFSPMYGIKQPFPTGERDRVLNDDEIRLFWIATRMEPEPFGRIARLLLLTAQRRSEIAEMERWQIDRHSRMLTLPICATKSHRAHVVPLSDLAMEVLDAVPRRAGQNMLFGREGDQPVHSRTFCYVNERIRKRMLELRRAEIAATGGDPDDAHIPHWVFHDLRRTGATLMARLGHPVEVVDKILNHAGGRTGIGRTINSVTRIYVRHEFLDERRAALQDLGTYVATLVVV